MKVYTTHEYCQTWVVDSREAVAGISQETSVDKSSGTKDNMEQGDTTTSKASSSSPIKKTLTRNTKSLSLRPTALSMRNKNCPNDVASDTSSSESDTSETDTSDTSDAETTDTSVGDDDSSMVESVVTIVITPCDDSVEEFANIHDVDEMITERVDEASEYDTVLSDDEEGENNTRSDQAVAGSSVLDDKSKSVVTDATDIDSPDLMQFEDDEPISASNVAPDGLHSDKLGCDEIKKMDDRETLESGVIDLIGSHTATTLSRETMSMTTNMPMESYVSMAMIGTKTVPVSKSVQVNTANVSALTKVISENKTYHPISITCSSTTANTERQTNSSEKKPGSQPPTFIQPMVITPGRNLSQDITAKAGSTFITDQPIIPTQAVVASHQPLTAIQPGNKEQTKGSVSQQFSTQGDDSGSGRENSVGVVCHQPVTETFTQCPDGLSVLCFQLQSDSVANQSPDGVSQRNEGVLDLTGGASTETTCSYVDDNHTENQIAWRMSRDNREKDKEYQVKKISSIESDNINRRYSSEISIMIQGPGTVSHPDNDGGDVLLDSIDSTVMKQVTLDSSVDMVHIVGADSRAINTSPQDMIVDYQDISADCQDIGADCQDIGADCQDIGADCQDLIGDHQDMDMTSDPDEVSQESMSSGSYDVQGYESKYRMSDAVDMDNEGNYKTEQNKTDTFEQVVHQRTSNSDDVHMIPVSNETTNDIEFKDDNTKVSMEWGLYNPVEKQ